MNNDINKKPNFLNHIIDFLTKEYNFNTIGSILSVVAQSFSYIILISYIIYNLIVLINPSPSQDNPLHNDERYISTLSIINDFDHIGIHYLEFLSSAVTLDFGNDYYGDERYSDIIASLKTTLIFLFSGLLMGLIVSIILIFMSYYPILKRITGFICKLSYLHLGILLWLANGFFVNNFQFDIHSMNTSQLIFFSSLFVSFGSGILADYYNLLQEEYDTIMNKDYVVFAKDSGFNYYYFALKELLFNLLNISISRVPIIFGGLVVIEFFLKSSNMQGISYYIVGSIGGDNTSLFSAVFICMCIFTPLYFSSQSIQKNIINK